MSLCSSGGGSWWFLHFHCLGQVIGEGLRWSCEGLRKTLATKRCCDTETLKPTIFLEIKVIHSKMASSNLHGAARILYRPWIHLGAIQCENEAHRDTNIKYASLHIVLLLSFMFFFLPLSLSLSKNEISTQLIAHIVRKINKPHTVHIWNWKHTQRYPKLDMISMALHETCTNKSIIYITSHYITKHGGQSYLLHPAILLCPARILHHSELMQHASTDLSNNFNINSPKELVRDATATVARQQMRPWKTMGRLRWGRTVRRPIIKPGKVCSNQYVISRMSNRPRDVTFLHQ